MSSFWLYVVATLIWGSTWLVITCQLGSVPPEVSVVYRFASASLILFAYCGVRRLPLRFSPSEHFWMALQGALLFGINYILVYYAEGRLNSGLVAVIFSLSVFVNMLGSRLFFSTPMQKSSLLGAVLGFAGLLLIFIKDLQRVAGGDLLISGLLMALVGMCSASFGSLASARNQRHGLPVVQLNAFGMLYGTLLVAVYAIVRGQDFTFDWSPQYVSSLFYLSFFGSVLAFGAYLTLIGRIGADRASYVTVAVPVVALFLSTLFEGLHWRLEMLVGVALCLLGNVLVLRRKG